MDSHSSYLNATLLVRAICIFLQKDYWIESQTRLTKTMQKPSGTVIRLGS